MSENDPNENYKTAKNLTTRGDFVGRYATRDWFSFIADQSGDLDGQILDVGCGVGWFWARMASRWQPDKLTLLDQSEGMLATISKKIDGLYTFETVQGDAVTLPFYDNQFDALVAMHMLYHVADIPQAIEEMRRVLKPGGRLIVTTVGDGDLGPLSELSCQIFGSAGSHIVEGAFGTAKADSYLRAAFPNVQHHAFLDEYQVDDAEAALTYIKSFPPGISAQDDQLEAFQAAVQDGINQGGGTLNMDRKQSVFVATKDT